jgi:hypothetical protein
LSNKGAGVYDYGDIKISLPSDNKFTETRIALGGLLKVDYGVYNKDSDPFVRGDTLLTLTSN